MLTRQIVECRDCCCAETRVEHNNQVRNTQTSALQSRYNFNPHHIDQEKLAGMFHDREL